MEIKNVMAQLGITQAQADALDAIDGKDGKISKSVFTMAQGMLGPNTPEGHKELRKQDPVLANQVELALHPLPETMSKKSEQNLLFAGIDKDMADWLNVKEAYFENQNGHKFLVLKSSDNFELRINTSDKDYDPTKIEFWRAEDDYNIHLKGISAGELIIKGADYDSGFELESTGFAIHNSNMSVECADGIADKVAVCEGSNVDIKTNDWADTEQIRIDDEIKSEKRLKPGGSSITTKSSKE